MTVPLRAALDLRVSTAWQAEHDVSIPDQKRQGEAYFAALDCILKRPTYVGRHEFNKRARNKALKPEQARIGGRPAAQAPL
jgi:hypothetical protein